jgi:penicillin-binding protein 1B
VTRQRLRILALLLATLAFALVLSTAHVERRFRAAIAWQPSRVLVAGGSDAAWGEAVVIPDDRGRRRIPVALESLPPLLVAAVMLLEDRRFFEHPGLDPWRIGGAAIANLRAAGIAEGGSTITQQLVRTVALSRARTLTRKLREAAGALWLEARFEKRVLLAGYLNEVYLAQDGAVAVHGVEAAARSVFGKSAASLDLAESALLAGMIQAPSRYAPSRHPDAARARRHVVLDRLRSAGRITAADAAAADARPLVPEAFAASPRRARFALDFVRQQVAAQVGAETLARGGIEIRATLDERLQALAEDAVARGVARMESERPALRADGPRIEAALVVLDPRSGALRALVGGRDYAGSPFDRAAFARRQPGSTFKPFVLLAAIARRDGRAPAFTLASLIEDAPLQIPMPRGEAWQPENPDHQFRGDMTLRYAIEQSLNTPFARLGLEVGLDRVVALARALGVAGRLAPVPSLSLGVFETSPLAMTHAYATLAAGGVRTPLRVASEVRDAGGRMLGQGDATPAKVVSAAEAFVVTSALQGAANRGSAAPLRRLGFHGDVAMKTGTSDGFRDAWAVGYTPELTIGVWVGTDGARSIEQSGAEAALPIAADFLVAALGPRGRSVFVPPPGLERANVDVPFGDFCLPTREVFLAGTAPGNTCRALRASSLTAPHVP